MSFSSKANYINDCINGIAYLDFVSDLSSNFKDKADALIIDLELLTKYIFTKENFFAFATCETGEEKKYLTEAESFYASLKDKEALPCDEFVFTPSVKKEAFIAPFDVNYVARACLNNAIKVGGKNEVLINALSMDYYWQLLRVKGGAYGGGIVMNFLLPFGLYSYRDPHATFDLFKRFGYQSGKTVDKFKDYPDYRLAKNGLPFIAKNSNSYLSLECVEVIDLGSHYGFVCKVVDGVELSKEASVTYTYYLDNIKPKPARDEKKVIGWRCKICGYIYEGKDLPKDFVCPICKHPASDFEKIGW